MYVTWAATFWSIQFDDYVKLCPIFPKNILGKQENNTFLIRICLDRVNK